MAAKHGHLPREEGVTFRGALPGLILILALEGAYWLGGSAVRAWLLAQAWIWLFLFVALPVGYLVASRQGPGALGYHRRQSVGWYARGVAVGALWRLADVAVNYYGLLRASGQPRPGFQPGSIVGALVLIPLVEETFFRGYLQQGLAARGGAAVAIVGQALLFALHPLHAVQGWGALPSILLFGLLAGLLVWVSRSLWSAWGAHGAGNLLPMVVGWISGWWWG